MKDHEDIFGDVVSALSLSMDLDESAKLYHGSVVAILASGLAERIIPDEICTIFYGGLLHDLGGVGVLSTIIHSNHPERLSVWSHIVDHPYRGAEILRLLPIPFEGVQKMADYILEHHERWDGKGYPSRKRGDEILTGSQLIRIADAFDVLVYRAKLPLPQAMKKALEFLKGSGECSPTLLKSLTDLVNGELFESPLEKELISHRISEMRRSCRIRPLREVDSSELMESLLFSFARVIDSKHPYTRGHSERVASYSVQIAKMMGLGETEVQSIKFGSLLHDIGKLSVPTEIMDKPGSLHDKEWEKVKSHSEVGLRVLKAFPSLQRFSFATLHHERLDGKGYPLGLRGEEIPLGARIISAADMLDALTSKRPYRKPMTFKEALATIKGEEGRKLDPRVVEALFETFSYSPLEVEAK